MEITSMSDDYYTTDPIDPNIKHFHGIVHFCSSCGEPCPPDFIAAIYNLGDRKIEICKDCQKKGAHLNITITVPAQKSKE